ncbi:hypothetical protein EVAR_36498_1 [Eumeta japonica]|uniref:Uncharacterized protein n=1 Tax=Eumeta variegata TaxID=151549 RepID=A0A4C1WUI4_EUMVA|nr:hypothetical protein EVAR_36498_1 [Eumeta japonica]
MSESNDAHKVSEIKTDNPDVDVSHKVTVSVGESESEQLNFCRVQKSFISIHSTDQLHQVPTVECTAQPDECHVEVLTLNEVFPETSEESLSNVDESPTSKKKCGRKTKIHKAKHNLRPAHCPVNSNSSCRLKVETQNRMSGCSDFGIAKSTIHVMGSNPGEPKMSYVDPPQRTTKTMKKRFRNTEKQKSDYKGRNSEQTAKGHIIRSILKDGRCALECTGDTTSLGCDAAVPGDEGMVAYSTEYNPHIYYSKPYNDKNVTFNTQVIIIHFMGDICVGQSVETLNKETDQQARNSELRKTFISKYNEFWPT